jgi:hypothetical protein
MTTSSWRLPLAAVIVVLGASAGVRSQAPRPMGIVDLLSIPRLSDPQLSPGGKDVLYTRAEADWKRGRRQWHIWRAPTDDGQPVQLTSSADGPVRAGRPTERPSPLRRSAATMSSRRFISFQATAAKRGA